MELENLRKLSYAMQVAYKKTRTRDEAILDVAKQFPDLMKELLKDKPNDHTLLAMWLAIDAYVDINT